MASTTSTSNSSSTSFEQDPAVVEDISNPLYLDHVEIQNQKSRMILETHILKAMDLGFLNCKDIASINQGDSSITAYFT